MKHVAALASVSAPWVLPAIGLGVFLHKHFICDVSNPADARVKAIARGRPPKLKRKGNSRPAAEQSVHVDEDYAAPEDHERQLEDAVLGRPGTYEWFTEDEVEALQQAQANPQALLSLLQQYGSCLAAEEFDEEDSDDSMWYTDDSGHGWQYDSPNSEQQQQQRSLRIRPLDAGDAGSDSSDVDTHGTTAGQPQAQQQRQSQQGLPTQQWAAQQQQQQQAADSSSQAAGETPGAAGAYFDNSYFGLPADASAAPQDLQQLQVEVSKNLEALLPKDATWAGSSYPPRFDEVLSPDGGFELPEPDWDMDFDPGFDYVPDFDYDPEFDDDMFSFDLDVQP